MSNILIFIFFLYLFFIITLYLFFIINIFIYLNIYIYNIYEYIIYKYLQSLLIFDRNFSVWSYFWEERYFVLSRHYVTRVREMAAASNSRRRPECRRLRRIHSLTLSSFLVCHRVASVRAPVPFPRDRFVFEKQDRDSSVECRASRARDSCSGLCAREIAEASRAIETATE